MTSVPDSIWQMWLGSNGIPGSGFALVVGLLFKGTLLLLLAATLVLALRRASAATRHLVWTLALAAVLALPVLALTLPAWKVPIISAPAPAAAGRRITMRESISTGTQQPRVAQETAGRRATPLASATPSGPDWLRWVLSLWALGSVLLMARMALGEMRIRSLVRHSEFFETNEARAILENVRRRLLSHRAVELRASAEIGMPFTQGVFQSAICLPSEARRWSQEQLEFVLAHELAHVKRYDCLTQMLAQAVCVLFWFHPLVWFAAFQMRKERERACDDMVLGIGHEATEYAAFLLRLARSVRLIAPVWSASVSMAQPSRFESRIRALLDARLNHRPVTASRGQTLAILAVVLVLPVAAIQATVKKNPSVADYDSTNSIPPQVWKILSQVGNKYAGLKSYQFSGNDEVTIALDKSTYRFTNPMEIFSAGTPQSSGCRFTGGKFEKVAGNGPAKPARLRVAMPCGDVYGFGTLPENTLSAKLLGEGAVEANGETARCYIIQLRWRPVEGRPAITQDDLETLWVDKSSHLVLRTHFNKFNDVNSANPHVVERWSTTFSSYQLNAPTPNWLRTLKQHSEEQDRALSARMAGKPAPAFTLKDLNGHSISLGSLRGKVVLLDFWATWCGSCKEEEPVLEKLGKERGTDSLAILRITNQSPELVRQFLQRTGENFPTLVDGNKVSSEYEVRGIPTLVIIDRTGKIVRYNPGFLSESDLEGDLAREGL